LENRLNEASDTSEQIRILNMLFLACEFNDLDKATAYLNKAFGLVNGTRFRKELSTVYTNKGYFAEDTGNYSAAEENYRAALEISIELGDIRGIFRGYNSMGVTCKYQSNFPEALHYYLQALALLEKWDAYIRKNGSESEILELDGRYSVIYNNLGNLHYNQLNYTESEAFFLDAVRIDRKLGDLKGLAIDYNNLGLLYWRIDEFDKSIAYFDSAQTLHEKNEFTQGISEVIMNRCITLKYKALEARNKGDQVTADSLFQRIIRENLYAIELKKTTGDKVGIGHAHQNLGMIYFELKDYARAREYLEKARLVMIEIDSKTNLSNNYNSLYKIDSVEQKWKDAFTHYALYNKFEKSILNENNTKKIVAIEMQHTFNRQRLQDSLAHAESDKVKDAQIAARDLAIEKDRILKVTLYSGLALVVVFSLIIFSRLKLTRKQKNIIEQQKHLVERQKEVVEEKNKEILDSINYAKRIQNAILPPQGDLNKLVGDSFILYKPKDIVAGDFYWLEQSGDNILVAAADCTGHGVPGAMVSVLCSNALTKCVKELGLTDPAKILDKTVEILEENFAKSEVTMNDGMDIAICCFDLAQMKMFFAGANNPIYQVRSEVLEEIKADKQPIGKFENRRPYRQHEIKLQAGDRYYLLTDGYADQFGGPEGKKFKYKALKETLLSLHGQDMKTQQLKLNEIFENWKGNLEQVDDVCVIGLKV
jgi:serine phosphatase RsbU (regulator of sigma subunit)